MSLFDSASLVVTPNGYKEDKLYSIKPTDGSGDLVVTRATTATRVNSDGLIEPVAYNLLTYSEQFNNASWVKFNSTITANSVIAPNGTLTADKLVENTSNTNHYLSQFITNQNSLFTYSVYAKKAERDFLFINAFATIPNNFTYVPSAYFNLSNGTIGTVSNCNASIQDVGNGWYRCTIQCTSIFAQTSANVAFYNYTAIANNNNSYLGDGTSGIYLWGAQIVNGTSAKEYFPTTDRLDVPRLDYTNSSCPSILVEPQRTNLVTYSEAFNDTSWNVASTSTVTLNSGIAPNGTNTANLITATSVDGRRIKSLSLSAGTYTYSYFVKKGNQSSIQVLAFNSTLSAVAQSATFDLDNGTLTSGTGTIQQFTNGWYKVSVTFTIAATNTILLYIKSGLANNAIGSTVYAWGAQLEAGSNATSYVPTVASTVTRNADVISKTGISSLIGQTEGTIFWDIKDLTGSTSTGNPEFRIRNTAFTNWIGITASSFASPFRVTVRRTAGSIIDYTANITRAKACVKYGAFGAKLFVNGVQVATSALNPSFSFDMFELIGSNISYKTNVSALFQTALSDDECINLTTL